MVKELVPVAIAVALWGRSWCRMQVCFHVDSMGVVAILWRYSAGGEVTHHLLHCLYFYSIIFQFEFSVEPVPGVHNTATAALSCSNIALFSPLLLQASQVQIPVPLLDLLLSQQPDWGPALWITLFSNTFLLACTLHSGILSLCNQLLPYLLHAIQSFSSTTESRQCLTLLRIWPVPVLLISQFNHNLRASASSKLQVVFQIQSWVPS